MIEIQAIRLAERSRQSRAAAEARNELVTAKCRQSRDGLVGRLGMRCPLEPLEF